ALSGVGGDELFGGYPSFADVPRLVRVLGLIGPAAPLSGSLVSQWPSTRAAKLGAILSAAPKSAADIWWEYRRLFTDDDVQAIEGAPAPRMPSLGGRTGDLFSLIRYLEFRYFLE